MGRSLESLSRSSNIDMGKDPEGINGGNNNANKPDTFEEHMRKHGSLLDYIKDTLGKDAQETTTKNEEHEQAVNEARDAVLKAFNKNDANESLPTETSNNNVENVNLARYQSIWEQEKSKADRSGINPETGRYEKGRATIPPENEATVKYRKMLIEKQLLGQQLTMSEKMNFGRDGVLYKWNGYKLKPDCCYRKINRKTLEQYQKSGFVDNNIDLSTLVRKNGGKIKGRIDTVDWFLGATTPRYGDILIETPASEEYFIPVERPGDKGNLLADTEALHMHSSGIVNPIPMSKVKVINGIESMSDEEQREAIRKGELSLSDISMTF